MKARTAVSFAAASVVLMTVLRHRRKKAVTLELLPGLDLDDVERYSRQMTLVGGRAQLRLKLSSVLVVGAGGIASGVVPLLAAAGIGKVGLMDADNVEKSNLHRQVMHSERTIGKLKVDSAREMLRSLNSKTEIETFPVMLSTNNVIDIFETYDLIIEATDSLESKYLTNDACRMMKKPFVSGAAQGYEGQFALHVPDGPCYRCAFPKPPPPSQRASCAENGVIGPVPILIGNMQALQAINYLCASISLEAPTDMGNHLYMVDGSRDMGIVRVKLSRKNMDRCPSCTGEINRETFLQMFEKFASENQLSSTCAPIEMCSKIEQINWREALARIDRSLLVDVREREEFLIHHVQGSINVPLKQVEANSKDLLEQANNYEAIMFICRRGNDSQKACGILENVAHADLSGKRAIYSVRGGLSQLSLCDELNLSP